ncbi:hypothetical protein [Wenzhouxiangella marina]|uniref:Uncharacterized protein n=1 Tax=Wenzhouxiangella marina TaxID=1579979 RepID=A0A0K0XU40_9GAMM|nr:hypothetical protein [Wenzhouxiangella marina]AKS41147.1 hypothetical protein WM2015_766 [Wenzhouxiangella marina]MBB6088026.1 hypothetical protein [Wenzhouxiangella marina]
MDLLKPHFTAALFSIAPLLSGQAGAETGLDCTAGCTIETCNATQCVVYYCREGGCTLVGFYSESEVNSVRDDQARLDSAASSNRPLFSRGTMNCGETECTVATCDAEACSVMSFLQGDIGQIGSFDPARSSFEAWVDEFILTPAEQHR